ncbi:MAG: class I SAM-dependent methyltransferase [Solirubrobacterales bacterium]
MALLIKDWNNHVADAEEVARTEGFRVLRDQILERAALGGGDTVIDVGAGTGLLTLPAAEVAGSVWAVDIAPGMCDYLRAKTASAGLDNIEPVVASAVSLPFVDALADAVISNYCFHHLRDSWKERALTESMRVLRPGGRLVFGDMMFRVGLADERDRRVVAQKVSAMLRKGPAGVVRLARNGARIASGRWEHPSRAEWWYEALGRAGFEEIEITVLDHEGGIASARRP